MLCAEMGKEEVKMEPVPVGWLLLVSSGRGHGDQCPAAAFGYKEAVMVVTVTGLTFWWSGQSSNGSGGFWTLNGTYHGISSMALWFLPSLIMTEAQLVLFSFFLDITPGGPA